MNEKRKLLIKSIALPLLVGAVAGLLTRNAMQDFDMLIKPPLSPPGWVFPVVWTILYVLMGYASYRVLTSGADKKQIQSALTFYGVQLALNFLWSPVFFGLQWRLFAFIILVAMWVFIYLTMRRFDKIDTPAADFLMPYILWVTFAAYLNLGVYFLNG